MLQIKYLMNHSHAAGGCPLFTTLLRRSVAASLLLLGVVAPSLEETPIVAHLAGSDGDWSLESLRALAGLAKKGENTGIT